MALFDRPTDCDLISVEKSSGRAECWESAAEKHHLRKK